MTALIDVQAQFDTRSVPLQRVGVSNLRYPVIWQDVSTSQTSIGTFAMGVLLNPHQKGAHLSRFINLLQNHYDSPSSLVISLSTIGLLHRQMLSELHATEGLFECSLTNFRQQRAPASQQNSLSYDAVTIQCDGPAEAELTITLGVMVTSLCPCSKEISQYGAHNQRSIIEVRLSVPQHQAEDLCLSTLARDIAAEGSCEIYNLLKRVDEKVVTEKAYENPKFSEDIVRDVVLMLQKKYSSFQILTISSTHLESIHQHDAFSIYQGQQK